MHHHTLALALSARTVGRQYRAIEDVVVAAIADPRVTHEAFPNEAVFLEVGVEVSPGAVDQDTLVGTASMTTNHRPTDVVVAMEEVAMMGMAATVETDTDKAIPVVEAPPLVAEDVVAGSRLNLSFRTNGL